LSSAGEAFLEPARQLLRDVATVRASVAAVADVAGGHLDLVALPTLAVDPMSTYIGAFRRAHPHVTVRLMEPEDADSVAAMVRSGRCEIGLAELPLTASDLESRPVLDQELRAVCPPGTKLGARPRLALDQLATMPLVTTPPGTSTRRVVDHAFASIGATPQIAVETGQREAILPLVLAGAGVAFLPAPLADVAARRGAVVAQVDPAQRRQIGLVSRPGPLSPAARAFIGLVLPDGLSGRRTRTPTRGR
jgi:DNA-binding transcriptional LysR family regulator